ncbi:MAG: hypothetical protein ABIP03_03575 [Aquihabitans sp.]
MPAVSLTIADLDPFVEIDELKAMAMIDDAIARAALVAPCILEETFTNTPAAVAIIRGAILRWHEAGSGAFQSEQVGPFGVSMDTRTSRKGMFLPSEIDDLKLLCGTSGGKAFSVNTAPVCYVHADICSLNFGALYCSCGADLTGGYPLWGN